jgi:two-component system sensor histidine kinase/response regulator
LPTHEPVRLSVLRAFVGDDEDATRAILRNFSTHSLDVAAQMRAACAAGELAAASDAAHKLKTAACTIGASALAELCAEMEHLCAIGDSAAVAERLELFNREEALVVAFLGRREGRLNCAK